MKQPAYARLNRHTIQLALGLVALALAAYFVYAAFTLNVSSPVSVNGATSATLNSATIRFPNATAGPTCTVMGSSASCPQVFLRQGGGAGEAGNYTIDISFTALPAGDTVTLSCMKTGPFTCTFPSSGTSTATVTSTGLPQMISPIVKPTGLGSGSASVTLTG